MRFSRLAGLVVASLLAAWPLLAVDGPQPVSSPLQFWHGALRRNILDSAIRMPAAGYGFRPVPEVRSFGELVTHVARTQFAFCSQMRGALDPWSARETDPPATKDEVLSVLEESGRFCEPAFLDLRDASLAKESGRGHTRMDWALLSLQHMASHYGNIVVYLRLCGIVPPKSDP